MKKYTNYAIITVLATGVIILGILFGLTYKDLSDTRVKASSLQNELAGTKTTLSSVQNDLSNTRTSFSNIQNELSNAKGTLSGVQNDLTNTKATLSNTQNDLTNNQVDLSNTKTSLSAAQAENLYIKSQLAIYQQTFAEPKPVIVSKSMIFQATGFLRLGAGQLVVTATVRNDGGAGQVTVQATTTAGSQSNTRSINVYLAQRDQKTVSIIMPNMANANLSVIAQ